ncbi:tRNA methyltransferase 10 homolog B isoform X3 [Gallus gallus]|uniref:tRNA methyltransferase 10 homolog B n=1 Tax=Gallus gallus TaxID=9031 RepID=A0A8V0X9J4_CHICK|nr:tRNA methyltransferase 10 homolog B isoform X3 [Gallus gallus]XP_046793250.1 tRNA methyltransferase 10 homolog B isoform X3 [Gallus gallus]|eukprot:XP_015136295.1 tRNA methyltransferase 10 homolog B isoform X2 [Gallus gallus]
MAVLRRRRGAQLGAEQGGRAEPAPPRPAPRRRRWRAAARWRTPRRRRWKRPARRSRCCGSSRRGPARRRARGTSFGSGGAGSGCWRRGGGGGRRRGSGAERGDPRAEVGRRGVRGRGGPGRAGLPSALCPAGAARQRGRALAEERLLEARSAGPRLCVDLGVADRMTPKETSRLAAQIRRLYGANRRAERPFWLCLTELVPGSPIHRECLRMNDGFSGYLMETTQESYLDLFPLDAIVYLTPDSENVLEDVDPEKVYVLGGLVDESIHKNLTLQRAQGQSLQTARLPIREYMVKSMNTKNYYSETLAINQVFDVLSTYYRTQSWPDALKAGVSSGKGYVLPDGEKSVKNTSA